MRTAEKVKVEEERDGRTSAVEEVKDKTSCGSVWFVLC